MSECIHIHDEEGHDTGYICRSGPFKYVARVHRRGARTYDVLSGHLDSLSEAFDQLRDKLLADRLRQYNRGDILAVEKEMSYYDPFVVYEVLVR